MIYLSKPQKWLSYISIAWFILVVINLGFNSYWWPWELLSAIPTFFWGIIGLIMLGVSILTRNLKVILPMLVAGVLVMPFVDFSLPTKDKFFPTASASLANSSTQIKVFNFNTLTWHSGDEQEFIDFLRAQDSDIYHLQEAFDQQLNLIDAVSYLKPHFPDYEILQAGDTVTMSRLKVVGQAQSEMYHLWQGYLRTDVEVDGQIYSFYNIHLPVPIRPDKITGWQQFAEATQGLFVARNDHMRELKTDIARQQSQNIPVVLTGDFNSTSFHQFMHDLETNYMLTDAHSYGYVGYPITFEFYGLRLWRLDWALVDSSLTVNKYAEITKRDFSDHDAILLTLQLN